MCTGLCCYSHEGFLAKLEHCKLQELVHKQRAVVEATRLLSDVVAAGNGFQRQQQSDGNVGLPFLRCAAIVSVSTVCSQPRDQCYLLSSLSAPTIDIVTYVL